MSRKTTHSSLCMDCATLGGNTECRREEYMMQASFFRGLQVFILQILRCKPLFWCTGYLNQHFYLIACLLREFTCILLVYASAFQLETASFLLSTHRTIIFSCIMQQLQQNILSNDSIPSYGSDTLMADGTKLASRGVQLNGKWGEHFNGQD